MLTVYTRHSQKCPHRDDIAWRRCRCPKWIQGTPSEDHEFLRTSAATRTWEQAEEKARKLEEEARPGARKTAPAITIEEAVAAYRADEAARCLSKSTTNQSKTLFQFHLLAPSASLNFATVIRLTRGTIKPRLRAVMNHDSHVMFHDSYSEYSIDRPRPRWHTSL
jgi:hypothetical protein